MVHKSADEQDRKLPPGVCGIYNARVHQGKSGNGGQGSITRRRGRRTSPAEEVSHPDRGKRAVATYLVPRNHPSALGDELGGLLVD